MTYPLMMYRQGWEDIDDNTIVNDDAGEKEARANGFKRMQEFPLPGSVADLPQMYNNATTKRRGRPPKVKNDDSSQPD